MVRVIQKKAGECSGSMYTVIGAPEGTISEVIARSGAHVKMFNIDCSGHVVIAGKTEAVRATVPALLPPGFRIFRLNVNAAFHSKLRV